MSEYCCRLREETIMAVVRNRSGIDAGEVDYSLMCAKFDKLSIGCLEDVIATLKTLKKKCEVRIEELKSEA